MIDPDIIASSDLPAGSLFVPVGESGENNPLCHGHDVHRSSCEIIQPVLIAIPNKNILSRMPLVPISIEKAISFRFVAVPVFSTHILYEVTRQGKENIFLKLAPGEIPLQSVGPLCDGIFSVPVRNVSIAHHALERLPSELRSGRLAQGRGEERQVEQDKKQHKAGGKSGPYRGATF